MFKFFDPISRCFAKYDAFCPHIFDYACPRLIAIKEVRNCGKIVHIKSMFENAGGRMHTSHSTPVYPLLAIIGL